MNIQVLEASAADFPVVQNLVRFYVYDMSETMGWACPESGLYGGCDDLPEYWWTGSTPESLARIQARLQIVIPFNLHFERWPPGCQGHPFLIRVAGELAGFAMVKQMAPSQVVDFDMGEFFVVRKFRRAGVGKQVAWQLFDRFPGQWEVRQLVDHLPAQTFWRAIIADYTDGHYHDSRQHIEAYGIDMIVQRFWST